MGREICTGSLPAESVDIFRRIGRWHASVRESFEGVEPAGDLTTNRNVMLTSRDRVLYVHINRDIPGNVVKLAPINVAPVRATLLNDGSKVDFTVRFSPSDHRAQKAYLNLINLPVNHMCNTVLVIKLEFDRPLDELAQPVSPKDGDSGWGKVGF